jgi:hypothetical protein
MTTMLDCLTDYLPADPDTIGFLRFTPALVAQADHDPVAPPADLTDAERDVLVAQLREVRNSLRRTACCGAVAWLDMSIVELSVGRFRVLADVPRDCRLAGDPAAA